MSINNIEMSKQKKILAVAVSVLLYGCTVWTLMKHFENRWKLYKDATCFFEQVM